MDCFERLKEYYKLKKSRYHLGREHLKAFYLKRKELKYDFKEWQSFLRNGIISLFFASNLLYFVKIRKSDNYISESFTFCKYSGLTFITLNFFIQKQLSRYYKREIKKYE